ncbi:TIR domain-containing protein [Kribbella sp. NPDC003557]|uniref:TIR domain-containing protein n=1 Tax=Kribbella sp. NPDC003557 TaxID=3154449 RepID=UPI0033A1BEFD
MLGIESFDRLISSLRTRMLLSEGRFEAHEFGRDEHASGTAGAVLLGLAGVQAIPTSELRTVAADVAALVRPTGDLRGHDSDPNMASTSWALAQIALALLRRSGTAAFHSSVVATLCRRLLSFQDQESGGWAFREGEAPQPLFAFYPSFALTRARAAGLLDTATVNLAVLGTAKYIAALLETRGVSREERLLLAHALHQLTTTSPDCFRHVPHSRELLDSALADSHTSGRLLLEDRSIVVYAQPTWHAVVWRPLFYLIARHHAPPTAPLGSLLGRELVEGFSRDLMAWTGPSVGVRTGTGASWASALALEATYRLATDIAATGLSARAWKSRCDEIAAERYEFDVAISFAGADRQIALEISHRLKTAGYRVFYDHDFQYALLGEDLTQYLQDTYANRSRYAIIVVSQAFLDSRWAGNWEWRAVLARMQRQSTAYVLPYLLEDIEVPGLNPTVGYVSQQQCAPTEFADLVVRKLRQDSP